MCRRRVVTIEPTLSLLAIAQTLTTPKSLVLHHFQAPAPHHAMEGVQPQSDLSLPQLLDAVERKLATIAGTIR